MTLPPPFRVVIQAVDAGFFDAPPKALPGNVYVVSYRDGHLRSFSGVPSYADRISCRFCFLVDTTDSIRPAKSR